MPKKIAYVCPLETKTKNKQINKQNVIIYLYFTFKYPSVWMLVKSERERYIVFMKRPNERDSLNKIYIYFTKRTILKGDKKYLTCL